MRLINADTLLEKMSYHCSVCKYHQIKSPRCRECDWHEAMNDVDDMNDTEAKPVLHAHWVNIWDRNYPDVSTYGRCTECNQVSKRPLGRYCRWCGAKMDEELEIKES